MKHLIWLRIFIIRYSQPKDCCRRACQISQQLDNFVSRGFDVSRALVFPRSHVRSQDMCNYHASGLEHKPVITPMVNTWWRHQMQTFSALLALYMGNSSTPLVYSPRKGQWRGALMFSVICARINGWVNSGEACDLRRHRAHYDVIVMSRMKLLINILTQDSLPHKQICVITYLCHNLCEKPISKDSNWWGLHYLDNQYWSAPC